MSVVDGPHYYFREDGVDFIFKFERVPQNLPQFKIHTSYTEPLVGVDLVFENLETQTFGPNIFYEVIPFEMLYTNEENPQVIVTVNNMPAACVNLSCDYVYADPPALITGQTVSGNTVTIDGTNLPTTDISDTIAGTDCQVTSVTDTQLVCEL